MPSANTVACANAQPDMTLYRPRTVLPVLPGRWQRINVHVGNGDDSCQAEDQQDQGGEQDLLAELGNFPGVTDVWIT